MLQKKYELFQLSCFCESIDSCFTIFRDSSLGLRHHRSSMAGRPLLLVLVLGCLLRYEAIDNAFVVSQAFSSFSASTSRRQCWGCVVRAQRFRERLACTSKMLAAGGGDDVGKKAIAAGLLGLQLLGAPIAVVSRQAASGVSLPRLEVVVADARGKAPQTTEEELIEEVQRLEVETEVKGKLKQSKNKRAPLAKELKTPAKGKTSPRVKLVEIPDAKLTASVATIQGLSPYLDEVEYLITARSWDYLQGFLGVFASCEEDFVSLIDGMYPTNRPADLSARDSMQLEAQNVFLAVDDLYQASMSKKIKGAEKAYVKLALAYDRFMKAGQIVPIYDPVSSTEKFFNDIPDDMLRYERDSKVPLEIRDAVLILKGPDKGRTGKVVGVIKSRNEAIVRVDGTTREMRILELKDVARQLPDDPKMASLGGKKK